MNSEQTRELLNAAAAVYPNTYRGMDEVAKLRLLDETTATLAKYEYEDCISAWRRYKSEYTLRELNLGVFVGLAREEQAKRKREAKRQIEYTEPPRDQSWQTAKENCMRQCQMTFGWSEREYRKAMGEEE